MRRFPLLVSVLLLLAGAAVALGGTERERASALVVNEHIEALAQDGSTVAWIAGACPGKVKTWSLSTGKQATLASIPKLSGDYGGNCWTFQLNVGQRFPAFALAGRRALWGAFDEWGNDGHGSLVTAATGERPIRLEEVTWDNYFYGDYITGVAGDGSTLVYATLSVYPVGDDPDSCARGPCVFRVTSRRGQRVIGHTVRPLPGTTRPMAIAVSGGRIAIVPAGGSFRCARSCMDWPGPQAKPDGAVEVRDVASATLVTRFSPKGTVKAIALSPTVAAVLVQQGSTKRIERDDAATGALIGATAIESAAAADLAIGASRIVYRVGRAIWVLGAMNGQPRLLRTTSATPIGLSIEGDRVAWAENVSNRRARIQLVVVPRDSSVVPGIRGQRLP